MENQLKPIRNFLTGDKVHTGYSLKPQTLGAHLMNAISKDSPIEHPPVHRNYPTEHHDLTLRLLYGDPSDSDNWLFLSKSIRLLEKKLIVKHPPISDNEHNLLELELFRLQDKLLNLITGGS